MSKLRSSKHQYRPHLHGRQVPDVHHDGPGGHHHQQVGHYRVPAHQSHIAITCSVDKEPLPRAVPECVAKLCVILDGHRVNLASNLGKLSLNCILASSDLTSAHLKGPLLELHDHGVVDAGALGEDEDGELLEILHVLPQPPGNLEPVLGLGPLEPDVRRPPGEAALDDAHEAGVGLADQGVGPVH